MAFGIIIVSSIFVVACWIFSLLFKASMNGVTDNHNSSFEPKWFEDKDWIELKRKNDRMGSYSISVLLLFIVVIMHDAYLITSHFQDMSTLADVNVLFKFEEHLNAISTMPFVIFATCVAVMVSLEDKMRTIQRSYI